MCDLTMSGLTRSLRTRGTKAVAVNDPYVEVEGGEIPGSMTFGPQVVFDAERCIDVRSNRRHIGTVFQFFALGPHTFAAYQSGPYATSRSRSSPRLELANYASVPAGAGTAKRSHHISRVRSGKWFRSLVKRKAAQMKETLVSERRTLFRSLSASTKYDWTIKNG